MRPSVSVIVIAHSRKKFLKYAMRSIKNQIVDKSTVEVIVVKNYEDYEVDDLCNVSGYINIFTDAHSASEKLLIGFKASSGEIITFLEDDDMFLDRKIEHIIEVFRSNSRIGYFHNDYLIIDENYNNAEVEHPKAVENSYKGVTIYGSYPDFETIHTLVRGRNDFNISSIAVSRSFLDETIKNFGDYLFATDFYLFYSALVSDYSIAVDHSVLTLYRVHGSNASLATANSIKRTEFVAGRVKIFKDLDSWRKHLLNVLEKVPNSGYAVEYLKFQTVIQNIDVNSLAGNFTKGDLIKFLHHFLIACPKKDIMLQIIIISFGLLSLFSLTATKILYFSLFFKVSPLK